MSSPRPWRWQRQILRAALPDGRRIADELEELFVRRLQLQHLLWVHGWHTRQLIGLLLRAPILWHAERATQRAAHERGDGMMRTVLRDIRFACRGLLRTPGQTLAAIIALGLGIGITTTEFSVLYGGFYRTLPFEDGERLVSVRATSGRVHSRQDTSGPVRT